MPAPSCRVILARLEYGSWCVAYALTENDKFATTQRPLIRNRSRPDAGASLTFFASSKRMPFMNPNSRDGHSTPMRIALVITELDPGGAEKCLVQLAAYLKHHGHAVKVFALGTKPQRDRATLLQQLETLDVDTEFGNATSIWSLPRTRRWLRLRLCNFAPQIVQSMLFHGNLLAVLSADLKKSLVIGGVRVRPPERGRWWLHRWAAKRMRKLVCVSDDVLRHCQERERIPRGKLLVIPNGVELADIDRQVQSALSLRWSELGVPTSARVLLFAGRLHVQKGIDKLVDHADRLLDELPEHHLVLLGAGPLEQKLQAAAKKLKHANRVHFAGWQPNPIQWISRAEQLLLPAVYEGMPNVVLEAMATRRPIVAFDIDGVGQALGDCQSSINQRQIAVPGDFNSFIGLVQNLACNANDRLECGAYNRARIEENFLLTKQLDLYEQLYQSELQRRR